MAETHIYVTGAEQNENRLDPSSDGDLGLVPSVESCGSNTADRAKIIAACQGSLTTTIIQLMKRKSQGPLKTTEAVLSLKECLSRLTEWKPQFSRIQTDEDAAGEEQHFDTNPLLSKITPMLLQLLSLLTEFSDMVRVSSGEGPDTLYSAAGSSPVDIQEALEQIEDTIDCLWSYRTALDIASQIQTQAIDVPIRLPDMASPSLPEKAALLESVRLPAEVLKEDSGTIAESSTDVAVRPKNLFSHKSKQDDYFSPFYSVEMKKTDWGCAGMYKETLGVSDPNWPPGHVSWLDKTLEKPLKGRIPGPRYPEGGAEIRRKIVAVGDGACGKTCTYITFCKGTFPEVYVPTVFENYVADVEVDSTHVELACWDTAGQEDYDRLRPLCYPDSHAIMISFAIDSPASLLNTYHKWISEVMNFCSGLPIILAGFKHDLKEDKQTIEWLAKDSDRPVTYSDGLAVAKDIGAAAYVECSAKTGEGIRSLFETVTGCALRIGRGLQHRKAELCNLM